MQELTIKGLSDLPAAVDALLAYAQGRKVFCFSGNLGAGKTTFIKQFYQKLNVVEEVVSPTYSLINEYTYTDEEGREKLAYHMDLYRLSSSDEAFEIGIEDYIYSDNYVMIEWFEIIEDRLPEDAIIIKIELQSDSSRKMIFL